MLRYGLGGGESSSPVGSSEFGSSDLNDWNRSGFYTVSINDGQNTPTGSTSMTGILMSVIRRWETGTSGLQIAPIGNVFYYRTKSSATWNPWLALATQDYVQTQVNGLTTLTDDGVAVVGSADYNNLTAPGFYHCNETNSQNGPGGANKLFVLTTTGDAPKHITQVAFPIYNTSKGCPAIRYMSGNGTWSDWFKLALIDSNETIAANGLLLKSNANLQFAGNSSSSVPNYSFQVSNFAKGDTPAKSFTTRYYLYDQNNNAVAVGALAGLELGVLEDGTTQASLIAFRNQAGVSSNQRINIRCKPDGSAITSTPHPVTSSDDNSIATTAWVRALLEAGLGEAIPAGTILPYAGKTVPSGFLAANGGNVSRTTYARLYGAIGTTWGSGDGSTTFKLPDFRNRTIWGANAASEVGTYLESGAPNITGYITGGGQSYTTQYGGAFYEYGGSTDTADSGHSTVPVVGFDASRSNPIYGNAEIIQPPAGKALWIIKV